MKMTSACSIALVISVVNVRRPSRRFLLTSSCRPGSCMGSWPSWSIAILLSTLSTQVTWTPNSAKHAPVTRPTYPVPTTAMFIPLPSRGATASVHEPVLHQAPDRRHAVLPVDLLALSVVAAVVGDRDLVDPPPAAGHLHGELRLEPEPVRPEDEAVEHLPPEDLVAGLHVGQVDVRQHVAQEGQKPVAGIMPEKVHPV